LTGLGRTTGEERLEVVGRPAGEARIVLEVAEPEIAVAAEQATHALARMRMIDRERLLGRPGVADGAGAVLPRHHGVVVCSRHPVEALEHALALSGRIVRALARLDIGILGIRILGAPLRPRLLDLVLVGLMPGLVDGQHLGAKHRILGVALALAFAVRGHGGLLVWKCAIARAGEGARARHIDVVEVRIVGAVSRA